MSQEKIVYGVPFSQPVRSVLWLLLIKKMPFELKLINPGSSSEGGSRHPDYLKKFPTGTIPSYEEPDSGFFSLNRMQFSLIYVISMDGKIFIPLTWKTEQELILTFTCITEM